MNTRSSITLSFALICALIGFPIISETIYTPSLPSIAESLGVSAHWVEWTLSIYFIGFAAGVGFWGILSDKIGRRPVMLLGILIYCIATFGCLLAKNIESLLLFRFIQAMGASVGSVVTQTMMRDIFSGKELSRLFSLISMPISAAPALGPFFGSWLDAQFDWRANFIALLAMGLCLLAICLVKLPETRPSSLTSFSFSSLLKLAGQLCQDKKVLGCAVLVAALNGILFSFFAEAPFILMELMGLSATHYGAVGLAIALAGVIGSMVSHRLHHYFTSEQIIGIGLGILFLGSTGMVFVVHSGVLCAAYLWLGTGLLLSMMFIIILGGMGLAIPNILAMALRNYQAVSGRAGSLFGLGYYSLVGLITALMGSLHDGSAFPMPWFFWGLSVMMIVVYYQTLLLPALKENKIST